MNDEFFDRSINLWCLGSVGCCKLPKSIQIGGKACYYSERTPALEAVCDNVHILIIGTCVDATGELSQREVASRLCISSFDVFRNLIDNLCGVYAIFRVEKDGSMKVFGDATHMMPIYYSIVGQGERIVASCESLLVNDVAQISKSAEEILSSGPRGQCELVNDLTVYENVKCLLPNHYLDVSILAPIRYFPREPLNSVRSESEINEIVDKTIELCRNSIRQFSGQFNFASPLTQGADSRVNCAFLNKETGCENTIYYLILNIEMVKCHRNVGFIKTLAERMSLGDFRIFQEAPTIDKHLVSMLKTRLGEIRPWGSYIWAYHPSLTGRAIVNGQIIGQIGKASMGEGRPEFLSKHFLWIRKGNVSKQAYQHFLKWYNTAKADAKGYSMYDLWGWELRCGRWNSNLISKNSILGIMDLNFYNCRKIISSWCRIPRKLREKKIIHKKLLEKLAPGLQNIPFNPYWMPSRHLSPMANMVINWIFPGYIQQLCNYWRRKFMLLKERGKRK